MQDGKNAMLNVYEKIMVIIAFFSLHHGNKRELFNLQERDSSKYKFITLTVIALTHSVDVMHLLQWE